MHISYGGTTMVCLSVSSAFRLQVVNTSVQDKMNRVILLCNHQELVQLPKHVELPTEK